LIVAGRRVEVTGILIVSNSEVNQINAAFRVTRSPKTGLRVLCLRAQKEEVMKTAMFIETSNQVVKVLRHRMVNDMLDMLGPVPLSAVIDGVNNSVQIIAAVISL